MNREEIIWRIKRNRNTKKEAITLIADFLDIKTKQAEQIYKEEFEIDKLDKSKEK